MSAASLSSGTRVTWNGQPAFWRGLACHQTPDDLWNFAEVIWSRVPSMTLEVGTGEGGTSRFLRAMIPNVHTVDVGDIVRLSYPFVILDGDVYQEASMLADLHRYGPDARWLVVCHTNREDWGAVHALRQWLPHHPEWTEFSVRHPTQHTWLTR